MSAYCHAAFAIEDPSRVGEVRRHAVQLATLLGFGEVAAARVAIVATELANNLLRHAVGGRMLVGVAESPGEAFVELMSLDLGPGMADVGASLADGFSTGGTPGTGLGAVRRQSQVFDLYSRPGAGTVVLARLSASGRPPAASSCSHGVVRLPAPGEVACGDNWAVRTHEAGIDLIVADGLGHGPQAQEAGDAAVEVFETGRDLPSRMLGRIHERLRSTRGAAVAVASLDAGAASVTFAGVGNVAGRILSGVSDRSLMSQHGTAGMQVRKLQDITYDWPPHAIVLLHSDGFASRWSLDDARDVLQHHPAVVAGWIVRDQLRGRDDATLVVVRREHA